jgi:hypothetical protein
MLNGEFVTFIYGVGELLFNHKSPKNIYKEIIYCYRFILCYYIKYILMVALVTLNQRVTPEGIIIYRIIQGVDKFLSHQAKIGLCISKLTKIVSHQSNQINQHLKSLIVRY